MPGGRDVVVSHCLSLKRSRKANVCVFEVVEVAVVGARRCFDSSGNGAVVGKT
jgi:hypothetical protein